MTDLVRYGAHADQVLELSAPAGPQRGVAVLVHGGYWRPAFTRELMAPMAADLLARGWAVVDLEYRRGRASGGLRATLDDARDGIAAAVSEVRARGWSGPVVGVGHSVGGQLVLLHPAGLDAVVALAPVTDLARTRAERLGDDAVRELVDEGPEEDPDLYAAASPVEHVPVGCPVLVVHGRGDDRVPLAHSQDFVARARAAGDQVELRVLDGVDHRSLIDPGQPWWPGVVAWMAEQG